jgi:hypothetical protein
MNYQPVKPLLDDGNGKGREREGKGGRGTVYIVTMRRDFDGVLGLGWD